MSPTLPLTALAMLGFAGNWLLARLALADAAGSTGVRLTAILAAARRR